MNKFLIKTMVVVFLSVAMAAPVAANPACKSLSEKLANKKSYFAATSMVKARCKVLYKKRWLKADAKLKKILAKNPKAEPSCIANWKKLRQKKMLGVAKSWTQKRCFLPKNRS